MALLGFAGVVGGEGAYLWQLADVRGAGIVERVVAAVGSATALLLIPAPARSRCLAVLGGVAVGAGVYAAYAQPLIT